ncbi:MAG: type IV toxin-antitoxin system AbiEi family antitoxin [Aeromicrobium sp.]|uniref:type IV toxin-antitoxin system AbiEi family antitoxin n=1 Tax=Aeromicrobium sp. TaxID=1871063 RepID=UPI0039E382EA
MDERSARDLTDRWAELGLRLVPSVRLVDVPEGRPVEAVLEHTQGRQSFQVVHMSSLTESSLRASRLVGAADGRLLVLGPRVTERSARAFRLLGVNYLDAAGNAWVTFGGVHIDVRGRQRVAAGSTSERATRPGGGAVNLFSAKRAQVVFAILAWERLLSRPLRELAHAAGVSLGQAQQTRELLIRYGFLDERKQFLPGQRDRLLDQWANAYPTGLGAIETASPFSGEISGLDAGEHVVYVSGESAAPHLRHPETLTLYSDGLPVDLIRRRRWRRDTENPNILVRQTFWRAPDGEFPGLQAAPWPLVYADLLASGEARQRDAAEQVRAAS